ncbi:prolipoprotein diacylglyceryl transferase [Paroceanicella profunda]|uniref:Phosphatidylglycerol--prolipoprotein diacylglyceryl transferase n=1 Tax=Paroceanicella profunda TaxID=2579971 RepID=A0A5B8FZE0_9RHOB|nr:prolipoprotein diacylglyceryl transferase [Paroceanicella profunda]QDL92002.1 prolipoprotein diacylglyceryl transferase [Paroceanicella profunda]
MPLVLHFPDIDPVIFSIHLFGATLSLRWYAMAYIVGLLLGWRYIVWLVSRPRLWPADRAPMTREQPEELLTYMVLGVVVGGRLGYVLFYNLSQYLANPLEILKVWDGGMSFHGGMLGVVAGILLYARSRGLPALQVGDAVGMATPIGLALGRLANFINGELWGRPTDVPWGMVFPNAPCPEWWPTDVCARHPSQLYEAGLEGLVLLALMAVLALRFGWLKAPGRMVGVFLTGYGAARIFVENFRQGDGQFITPDNPWGHIFRFGTGPEAMGVTMGQVLSLPMVLAGLAFLAWSWRRGRRAA